MAICNSKYLKGRNSCGNNLPTDLHCVGVKGDIAHREHIALPKYNILG